MKRSKATPESPKPPMDDVAAYEELQGAQSDDDEGYIEVIPASRRPIAKPLEIAPSVFEGGPYLYFTERDLNRILGERQSEGFCLTEST